MLALCVHYQWHVPPFLAGCARRSSGCHRGCTWSCRSGQTRSRCPLHVAPEFPPGWWNAESEGQSARTHSCSLVQLCSLDTMHHPLPLSPVYNGRQKHPEGKSGNFTQSIIHESIFWDEEDVLRLKSSSRDFKVLPAIFCCCWLRPLTWSWNVFI